MTGGSAARRLARRLTPRADGNPGMLPATVAKLRQAVVDAVGATTVDVLLVDDDTVTTAGWLGARPAAGDTVWLALAGTVPIVLGKQQAMLRAYGDTGSVSTDANGDITVTHNLGTTPTWVQITDHSAQPVSFGRTHTVHSLTSTTFKVHCMYNDAATPSTSGWALYWEVRA